MQAVARVGRWFPWLGLSAGLALGVGARLWMRQISTDHEFTWSGTLAIVIGFGVFGLAHATAARAAQLPWRGWTRLTVRCLAGVATLPLFVAAGAVMAPTVVFGGLAAWRSTWPPAARAACAVVVVADIVLVGRTIVDDLGWSMRLVVGMAGLVVVYGALVWCTEGMVRRSPSDTPTGARGRTR